MREETDLDIKVVSREAEARLAVSGCASLIDASCDLALVFDIGGGSSELIWLDLEGHKRKSANASYIDRLEMQNCIVAWTSLPVGVVTLAERYGGRFVDEAIFQAMVADILAMLAPFEAEHRLRERMATRSTHLLGTSGTVTTMAGVHLRLPRYDRRQVDGCWLKIDASARGDGPASWRRPMRNGWRSPASARIAPTSCLPAAPSSRRCCRLGRASGCGLPIVDCARVYSPP